MSLYTQVSAIINLKISKYTSSYIPTYIPDRSKGDLHLNGAQEQL